MSTDDAKKYLSRREIPQLFESMMTGLMYYRPDDHLSYLQECLNKIKSDGVDKIRWNLFIEQRQRTPLPPIPSSAENGRRSQQAAPPLTRQPTDLRASRASPLPPIGQAAAAAAAAAPGQQAPHTPPVIFIIGGPGSNHTSISRSLCLKYSGWVHLSGELLIQTAAQRANKDPHQLYTADDQDSIKYKMQVIDTAISSYNKATGIVLDGFPITVDEATLYKNTVGGVVHAFVIDCEAATLQARMSGENQAMTFITERMDAFRSKTLPMIKILDDAGKLTIIEGERSESEIVEELSEKFDQLLSGQRPTRNFSPAASTSGPVSPRPRPPSSPRPYSRPGSSRYKQQAQQQAAQQQQTAQQQAAQQQEQPQRPMSGLLRGAGRLDVTVADPGRQPDMPQCPILLMFGGPGSRRAKLCTMIEQQYAGVVCLQAGELLRMKAGDGAAESDWQQARDTMAEGNMLDDTMVNNLLAITMKQFIGARAVIITGYPRNQTQIQHLHDTIGGITQAFVIDCEESTLLENLSDESRRAERFDNTQATIDNRILYFKTHTLPVIGHYDDQGKLFVINGERHTKEVFEDIQNVLTPLLNTESSSNAVLFNDVPTSIDVQAEEGEVTVPIISVIGGPNSGVSDIVSRISYTDDNIVFVENTSNTDEMISELKTKSSDPDNSVVLLENFPSCKEHIELINSQVGSISRVILVDHSVSKLQAGLAAGQQQAFDHYRKHTMPLLAHYDQKNKLSIVLGDRPSEDIYKDVEIAITRYSKTKEAEPFVKSEFDEPEQDLALPTAEEAGDEPIEHPPHVISLMGATGVKELADKIISTHADALYVPAETENLTTQQIVTEVRSNPHASFIMLENYPAETQQLEDFTTSIQGVSGAVLVDYTAETLTNKGVDEERIESFRARLPTLYDLEQQGLLHVVDGVEDETTIVTQTQANIDTILSLPVPEQPTGGK